MLWIRAAKNRWYYR